LLGKAPSHYERWLEPTIEDPRQILPLLTSYSSDAMQAEPVGSYVNSPANDSARCIERMMQKGNIPFPEWD
jgi:putative SOS response-associated peptidase YedK